LRRIFKANADHVTSCAIIRDSDVNNHNVSNLLETQKQSGPYDRTLWLSLGDITYNSKLWLSLVGSTLQ